MGYTGREDAIADAAYLIGYGRALIDLGDAQERCGAPAESVQHYRRQGNALLRRADRMLTDL